MLALGGPHSLPPARHTFTKAPPVTDNHWRIAEDKRDRRHITRRAADDVEPCPLHGAMPPPELRNRQRPAAEPIATRTRAGKISRRPKTRRLWVLQHPSKFTHKINSQERQRLFIGSRFGESTHPRLGTAGRVSDQREAPRPCPRIAFRVEHI